MTVGQYLTRFWTEWILLLWNRNFRISR